MPRIHVAGSAREGLSPFAVIRLFVENQHLGGMGRPAGPGHNVPPPFRSAKHDRDIAIRKPVGGMFDI